VGKYFKIIGIFFDVKRSCYHVIGMFLFAKGKHYIARGIFLDVIVKCSIAKVKYKSVRGKRYDVVLQ